MDNFFHKTKTFFLVLIIFLFPLFFLPLTQEFFLTNKLYLLAFGSLFLLFLSTVSFLLSKKISWSFHPLDNLIFLFLLTIGISIIIASPNKIQALLDPNFGLLTFVSLAILYFYLSRLSLSVVIYYSLSSSGLLVSLVTFLFFFQPFKNTNLPLSFQFLKDPFFSPLGAPIDLAIFLGFVVIYGLSRIVTDETEKSDGTNNAGKIENKIIHYSLLLVYLIALSLTLYNILKPQNLNQQSISNYLPPFRLSWYAAVEVLKQPLTALFGTGVNNFPSVFTIVKDLSFNLSPQWQISSFNYSRSSLLHLFTETGLFGFIAFSLIVWQLIKIVRKNPPSQKLIVYYSLLIIFFFPPSLISWFLFFLVLALSLTYSSTNYQSSETVTLDPSRFPPIYFGLAIFSLIFIIASFYLVGRSYLAEYYFKKSLDGAIKNNAKNFYDNIRQAIILNPYMEKFRLNFSQVNLIVANNIAQKINQDTKEKKEVSETDRQNISQAIQAAIAEAKAAVTLNPQKAENWYNLANIYQQIINTAQGADVWTISAYQRTIILDPQNPLYRINLGGVYYSLGNYEEAAKIFEQGVVLKPDWANAHYNLAWADYQRANYQRAVSEMENVLSLLNPKKDKADYEKAKRELEEFKKKLPKEEQKATESAQPTQLNLPTPIPTSQPQIKLPKEASPEAK